MWKKYFILILLFGMSLTAFAVPADPYSFTSPTEAERFTTLTHEIRCVVCQNQNIADSSAPLANDLRNKVYQMIITQQSDAQIKAYLVSRYGEFILLKPRLNKSTWLLWGFPLLGLSVGLLCLIRFFRHA
jgi:cytochrome c-type biogenesis protein CcmH